MSEGERGKGGEEAPQQKPPPSNLVVVSVLLLFALFVSVMFMAFGRRPKLETAPMQTSTSAPVAEEPEKPSKQADPAPSR